MAEDNHLNNDPTRKLPSGGGDDGLDRELADALGELNMQSFMDYETPDSSDLPEGVRRGQVISVEGEDIFVDFGGKSQGILAAEQFGHDPLPAVGDTVEVTIERYDPAEGLLILSRKGAVQAATWNSLEEGALIEGRVKGHNKGGLEMDFNGIKGFMPISQIDFERLEADELGQYDGRRLACQVVEVRRAERSIVVSRTGAMKIEQEQLRQATFETLNEGDVVEGVVKTIMPYGAFVDIGGVDGLLHIGDMSHARINDCSEVVKEGNRVKVKVIKLDPETRKIGLGLKQIAPDPWEGADLKWPPDSMVQGRVTKLMEFGAFVELEPGAEGLIPISEMSFAKRINHPREVVSEGEMVNVRVLDVDPIKKRIALSLKRVGDDPWMGASVRWATDSTAEGTVTRVTDFGAFVELTPGVEGLIHISELSEGRVNKVTDIVKEGQTVQVKILEVDEERRRIGLSIRALQAAPEYTGDLNAIPESPRPAKKRKKPLKGGLDW